VKSSTRTAAIVATALALVLSGCRDKSPTAPTPDSFMGCTVRSHNIGSTVNGTLTSACNLEGEYYDLYEFRLTQARTITITLGSAQFDTFLVLVQRTGADAAEFIAADDDGGTGTNSRLSRALQAGTYMIAVTSFGGTETGSYSLNTSSQ
jgi:hypothetical protein